MSDVPERKPVSDAPLPAPAPAPVPVPAPAVAVAEPAAAASTSLADVAWKEREAAFEKKRRPPQPPLSWRFLRFWLSPRVVMRDVLVNDPRRFVLLIAALAATDIAAMTDDEDASPDALLTFAAAFVGAALFGIARLYVRALVTGAVCRLLGGDITGGETRAVLAWSSLPIALSSLLGLPHAFATLGVRMDSPPGLFPALHSLGVDVVHAYDDAYAGAFGFAVVVAHLWAFVVEVVMLADAADVAKWRAFMASAASTLLPAALLVLAAVCL